jgi:hypothetical protein
MTNGANWYSKGTWDVCEVGVLEEGIALVSGKTMQNRYFHNVARMWLIEVPIACLCRAAPRDSITSSTKGGIAGDE